MVSMEEDQHLNENPNPPPPNANPANPSLRVRNLDHVQIGSEQARSVPDAMLATDIRSLPS